MDDIFWIVLVLIVTFLVVNHKAKNFSKSRGDSSTDGYVGGTHSDSSDCGGGDGGGCSGD